MAKATGLISALFGLKGAFEHIVLHFSKLAQHICMNFKNNEKFSADNRHAW